MASFGASSALRARWGDLLDAAPPLPPLQTPPLPAALPASLRSAVGWLKQASLEVRAAGSRAVSSFRSEGGDAGKDMARADTITLLHYNDVYNVDQSSNQEPVGGALRFSSALKALRPLSPLVLFSGDAFSPSMLSTFTKGAQMVPVLNEVGTNCAVFGNHDFDFGLETLLERAAECQFPWLMSNVVDRETGRPLADGRISHALTAAGRRLGLIGLVEQEWLETLATIDPEEVTFIDFVTAANQLAQQLKQEGCDMVIALTHMRTRNDIILAENCPLVDLILGGHDHDYQVTEVNNKLIVKSGTDFRQFSKITVQFGSGDAPPTISVEACDVTSHYPEDPELKPLLEKYTAMVEGKMDEVLGRFSVDLDGRFSSIRRHETNLGDWLCDVILAATHADLVILNSGTFRSDRVHGAGEFTLRDLSSVIPMRDPLLLVQARGAQLLAALENAVSKYPSLEGRFPQVSGVSFAFEPSQPPGRRVPPSLVKVGDEYLQLDATYRLCIKEYLHHGHDGFTMLKDCPVLVDSDMCPEIGVCVQNHFSSVSARRRRAPSAHRQSLVPLSRRHSLVKRAESEGSPSLRRTASLCEANTPHIKLSRRASLDDLEQQSCELAPRVDGRITIIDSPQTLHQLESQRARDIAAAVIAEDDETDH